MRTFGRFLRDLRSFVIGLLPSRSLAAAMDSI